MPIDFSKFQKKEVLAKAKSEIIPKIKKPIVDINTRFERSINVEISNLINKRLLKLVKIGLKHELSIENFKQYFREIGKSKLYELRRYFSDSNLKDIKEMLDFLYKNGTLVRDRNGWYSIKN